MKMAKEIRRENKRKQMLRFFLILLAALISACRANDTVLRSGKETPAQTNVETNKSSFAADLKSMRTAGFSFVYVLRRKDGGQIDAEDRGVIKLQTADANRRVSADEGRAFIVGSNFLLPIKNMTALYERFAVEDHSPPEAEANANVNTNK